VTSDDWRTSGHGPDTTDAPAPHGAAPGQSRTDDRQQTKDPLPPKVDASAYMLMLSGWWRDFVRAATFHTRIPFHIDEAEAARPLASTTRAFPLTGLVVGVVGAIVLLLSNLLGLPQLASSLLAVAATALVAGGLNEEGLANAADGLLTTKTGEEALRAMRESHLGAYGMLALVFIVGLKVAALEAIEAADAAASLIAAEVAGRTVLPAMLSFLPPARNEGISFAAGKPRQEDLALDLGLGAVLMLIMLGFGCGLAAIVSTAAVMALIIGVVRKRIGGHTGDILGATEQTVSTAVLLVAATVA
jgi:adenosylcobinamide-GDP ribazoletransferase